MPGCWSPCLHLRFYCPSLASTGHAIAGAAQLSIAHHLKALATNTPAAGFSSYTAPNAQAGSIRYNWPNAQSV